MVSDYVSQTDWEDLLPEKIPYSTEALRQDLGRLKSHWRECQENRQRNAIYGFLEAVFSLIGVWSAVQQEQRYADRALRIIGLGESPREEPYGSLLRCVTNIDRKTKSKWSRVLRYAREEKLSSEPLEEFLRSRGGLNKCAERYARRLGRHRGWRMKRGDEICLREPGTSSRDVRGRQLTRKH